MKNEKIFSKNGFYTFMLESNILLHKQVAATGQKLLLNWLVNRPTSDPIKLLDLACGGYPISVSTMLSAAKNHEFHYTGVDINPDQVEATKTNFQFPKNVLTVNVIEGNAWDLSSLPLEEKYDVIFTGLNLHHGTPEEIYCLLLQCKEKLKQNGLFINHDFYRPANTKYMRRPQVNPDNPSESFIMISNQTLSKYPAIKFDFPEVNYSLKEDWRMETGFIDLYTQILKDQQADEDGAKEVMDHVISRDFPISLDEMKYLSQKTGFELTVENLNAADQPLGEYFQLISATPH